jgi:hypothetical protein
MIVRAQPQQHAYKSIFILDRALFFKVNLVKILIFLGYMEHIAA